MMKLGNSTISKVMFGSAAIAKVMRGSELVFDSGSVNPIPSNPFIGTQNYSSSRNDAVGWVGFSFSSSVIITVTELGRLWRTGNANAHDVGIFSPTGDLIQKVSIPGLPVASPIHGTTYYIQLVTPITLAAQEYYVCASLEMNGDSYGDLSVQSNIASVKSSMAQCYRVGSAENGAFITGGLPDGSYGNPNFKFKIP